MYISKPHIQNVICTARASGELKTFELCLDFEKKWKKSFN